jgi:hypothetical protein
VDEFFCVFAFSLFFLMRLTFSRIRLGSPFWCPEQIKETNGKGKRSGLFRALYETSTSSLAKHSKAFRLINLYLRRESAKKAVISVSMVATRRNLLPLIGTL